MQTSVGGHLNRIADHRVTEEIAVTGTQDTMMVVAKADTGAKRTSIDTEVASTIGAGPIIDTVQVTSGTQRTRQVRPVIEIQLRLAGRWHTVTVSIEDQSHMEYPVLLGRDVRTGHQVDHRASRDRRISEWQVNVVYWAVDSLGGPPSAIIISKSNSDTVMLIGLLIMLVVMVIK